MSVSQYNRIYNLSLAVIVLYNIALLADMLFSAVDLGGIISKSAIIYLIFALGMLWYKIHLTRKFFLGNDVIYNLIAHGVLTGLSMVLLLIAIF